jgi:hypothetical protein
VEGGWIGECAETTEYEIVGRGWFLEFFEISNFFE